MGTESGDRGTRAIAEAVCTWFGREARDLPWRRPNREPYWALVSEFMLQQTQVARVVDRFEAFIRRFPDVSTLARAREASVLAMWSGLGYYRRARHLHAAARRIDQAHEGRVPADVEALRALPGVGEYTAGAISSMAFGQRVPAVDGNVTRVLLRLSGVEMDAAAGKPEATRLATELVEAAPSPGVLNEGLMELGAVICTPRSPACERCPVATWCVARQAGTQARIPSPARKAARRRLWCASVLVGDGEGRLLVQRRPSGGLWAGLWQAPTLERTDRAPSEAEVRKALGVRSLERVASFERVLTHRVVTFDVYRGRGGTGGAFKTRQQVERLGLATPQRRVLLEIGASALDEQG